MQLVDHILTLQQSLAHYERMLSQSHPTYLMELRLSVSKAKAASDKSIVMLSIISIGVLSVQTLIGTHLSMSMRNLMHLNLNSCYCRSTFNECSCPRKCDG